MITLYCLAFAGGRALSYRDFQAHVSNRILIKPLELPGRGIRVREALLTDSEAMIDDLFDQVREQNDGQAYAIYGHSMGSLLAYLLTQRLISAGLPAPLHLFLSGGKAPSVLGSDRQARYKLPKDEFINCVKSLGGIAREILDEPELIDFIEPILRADFQAFETYVYHPTAPFDIPMTILHGLSDIEIAYQDLLPWQQETHQPIAIKQFQGGHFFIFEHLAELGQLFNQALIR